MNKKNNLVFQENENAMIDVFIELLKKKDITKISVRDITEQSLVNRSTFYTHFQDIYELKEHAERRFEQELLNAFRKHTANEINHKQMFTILVKEIKCKKDYYKIYFNGLGRSRMNNGFYELIKAGLGYSNSDESDTFLIYQYVYFFDGMISILARWLNNNCDLSEEELINLLFLYWPNKETSIRNHKNGEIIKIKKEL